MENLVYTVTFLFHLQCVSYYLIPNAMRRFILLIVLAVVMCLSAIAHNFMFKHLEVRDGMPSNQINVIYKDSRGFMWFGTASGLARYDGYRFKVFIVRTMIRRLCPTVTSRRSWKTVKAVCGYVPREWVYHL